MRWHLLHRLDPAITLIALLLAVNLVAVLGLVTSRRDVRAAIREQRALENRADARTLEALLAQQHADISFLARTPPLSRLGDQAAGDDPVSRRWQRLDVEASLLLFMESSPAVSRLEVSWNAGPRAIAVRLSGVPQLAAPDRALPFDPSLVSADFALGDGDGRLRAWIDPQPLLATAGDGLRLHRRRPAEAEGTLEPVTSALWSPRFDGWVERREIDDGVARTVARLADRYGLTLIFNVSLIPLSLVLAGITLRRVRRVARLESEAAHQTRVQALERQVRHADRLASLGRFAAGIAHEINNPLEGMSNYLDLLAGDLNSGSADGARRWLPRLREGIDRAAGTVRQVLALAQPGRGDKRPLDLADVAQRTVEFLRRHPDCREAEIRVRAERPVAMTGDPQTLGQLVLNLVLNACQARRRGGEVEVLVRQDGDGDGELIVLDRGPGFPPAVLERLFEPFQSARGSLGLGLAVCHGIVTDHGGRIIVSARDDGAGSKVRVVLPIETVESPEEPR